MKYYLIYGLNSDFTYLDEFDDLESLVKYFYNFVKDNYEDDYKIIEGKEVHNDLLGV